MGEHGEATLQAGEESPRRQRLHPCCRQLDGQRQTVEPHTNLRECVFVVVCDGKSATCGPSALEKENRCVVTLELIEIRQAVRIRNLERRHWVLVLPGDAKMRTARCQHLQVRRRS